MVRLVLLSIVLNTTFLVAAPQPQTFRRPLVFEPNQGQAPPQVKWLARGPGYELFLTEEGVTMMMQEGGAADSLRNLKPTLTKLSYSAMSMKLAGSRPWNSVTGVEPTGGISNYLRGVDAKNSLTKIPHYARVSVASVYDGVDLVFYSHGGDLEYDFVVKPGADPTKIQLAFEGTERMSVDDKSGDLVLATAGGSKLRQLRPKVYQEVEGRRVEIAGGYKLLDHGRAAFTLADYDRSRPLVIDPTVSFVSFFGGNSVDYPHAVAVDSDGNTYVAGGTSSHNFPVTNGSRWQECHHDFLGFCAAASNNFVTKLSPAGTVLFSTYMGVGGAYGIAVDSTGVYVTGSVTAPDVDNPIGFGGGSDLFIAKLSLTGDSIYYNGFFDSNDEYGTAVAVDSQHNAWVVGTTDSPEFIGPGPRHSHALVGKFGPEGQKIFLPGYAYGSDGEDVAMAIAMDTDDRPWITGKTCGAGFPTTNAPIHQANGCAVFVLQLTRDGHQDMGMVFGGSDGGDAGTGIVLNGGHAAYIGGYTHSANFPTTVDGFQTSRTSQGPQAFVTEIQNLGFKGNIVHSTLLGGDGDTFGYALASDNAGGVYLAGSTTSLHFPGAPGPAPDTQVGFVAKFSFNLTQLRYSTLLGTEFFGLTVRKPAAPPSIPEIYAAGYGFRDGAPNPDALVVKLADDVAQPQVLWHNPATGELFAWALDAQGRVTNVQSLSRGCGAADGCSQSWKVIGTLDLNHDGIGDVLLHNAATGELQAWLLNSFDAVIGTQTLSRRCGTSDGCSQTWKPVGVGDFNHDGTSDILWHNDKTGALQAWLLDGASGVTGTLNLSKVCGAGCWPEWQIIAIGDFNSDGIDDLFWYDTKTGKVDVAMLNGSGAYLNTQWLAKVCGPSDGCSTDWKPAGMADVNQDGTGDLLWKNATTGELQAWLLNGTDRLLGTQSLSLRCDTASGCPQNSLPVGILRNHHVTP